MFQIRLALLVVQELIWTWELCSALSLVVRVVLALLELPVLEPVFKPEVAPRQAQLGGSGASKGSVCDDRSAKRRETGRNGFRHD
ncbi:hypothetical protein DPMN_038956 [Dreissena polymorpha]|uniref:Uncharacterized protein n=1 Tax=Dreissena polymorpha TaxID=45954 RepID=A0A9D4MI00_DREPO|nr:hypothetical protein DPMN_038956 [Dreissena polymorpha]